MQKFTLLLFILFSSLHSWAQSDSLQLVYVNHETLTKGAFIKSVDYNLSNLKSSNGYLLSQVISKVQSKNEKASFFYSIGDGTSVEYSDLLKIIEAINTLKEDVNKDIELKPDYLDNKYTNLDGFCVGYYVRMDKIKRAWAATWYLFFDKRNPDRELQFKDVAIIETAFREAKTKIEELKAK